MFLQHLLASYLWGFKRKILFVITLYSQCCQNLPGSYEYDPKNSKVLIDFAHNALDTKAVEVILTKCRRYQKITTGCYIAMKHYRECATIAARMFDQGIIIRQEK
jgi:hypothetical protein